MASQATGDQGASPVLFDMEGAVAIIRLNRPAQLNVLDAPLARGLVAALDVAAENEAVRAVVLSGTGRSFCAGGDLSVFQRDPAAAPEAATELIGLFHTALRGIALMPKPVIAAVHGPVAGGGFSLAVGCDLVVASEDASFLSAYTRLGTSPDGGLTATLTRLIGRSRALDMILTNERIDARTAHGWGLVNRLVPEGEAEKAAIALGRSFENASAATTAAVKRLVGEAAQGSFDAQLDAEEASFVERAGTPGFREGIAAFLERRQPKFPD